MLQHEYLFLYYKGKETTIYEILHPYTKLPTSSAINWFILLQIYKTTLSAINWFTKIKSNDIFKN